MTYNLTNTFDQQSARTYLDSLIKKGAKINITERRPKRTIAQNSYLHLLLGYFASQTGDTLDWVKQRYYKYLCNPDLFVRSREDKYLGNVTYLRSSADLTTEEMTMAIERFRNWAASEAGIYLPEATKAEELEALAMEVEKYKTYLY